MPPCSQKQAGQALHRLDSLARSLTVTEKKEAIHLECKRPLLLHFPSLVRKLGKLDHGRGTEGQGVKAGAGGANLNESWLRQGSSRVGQVETADALPGVGAIQVPGQLRRVSTKHDVKVRREGIPHIEVLHCIRLPALRIYEQHGRMQVALLVQERLLVACKLSSPCQGPLEPHTHRASTPTPHTHTRLEMRDGHEYLTNAQACRAWGHTRGYRGRERVREKKHANVERRRGERWSGWGG